MDNLLTLETVGNNDNTKQQCIYDYVHLILKITFAEHFKTDEHILKLKTFVRQTKIKHNIFFFLEIK